MPMMNFGFFANAGMTGGSLLRDLSESLLGRNGIVNAAGGRIRAAAKLRKVE
ncbi:MAG: hypothetical protein WA854_02925 [Candidatus Binataceae bacterium]